MAAWANLGVNYGGHLLSSSYDATAKANVSSDFTYLRSLGFNYIRIALCPYTDSASTAMLQDVVTKALAAGFYVLWGSSSGSTGVTATSWSAFKSYVVGTIAPWAAGLSTTQFELLLGNEEEIHCDGSTLTTTAIHSDITGAYATSVLAVYSNISYNTTEGQLSGYYAGSGIGSLPKIGFNLYNTLGAFKTNLQTMQTHLPTTSYVSEFSCGAGGTGGYFNYNDEEAFAVDIANRITLLKQYNYPMNFFFTYRDGHFGLTDNQYAFLLQSGSYRIAWNSLKGGRRDLTV